MDISPFCQRRARLQERIGDGAALLYAAPERLRNRDNFYAYRPDSYFWYLTGFPEPEATLVLAKGKTILFCRDKDAEREVWQGFHYGPEAACQTFGFDEAYPNEQLAERLPELIAGCPAVWQGIGYDANDDARLAQTLVVLRLQARSGKTAPGSIHDLRQALDEMRLIKDASEQAIMRRAAQLTDQGHRRAMRSCSPGRYEYELEAELAYEFRLGGATDHAYPPIVAGGPNACTLHYQRNDQPLTDGALVLIDAGCEFQGYAADVTRTFPVNGRFSAVQRDCYELVLAMQEAAIAATRPGVPYDAPHQAAVRILTQGLKDLKLLVGDLDGLIEAGAYKRFYMHNTGHWLGLDVHDAGAYKLQGDWRPLVPGMALTVEPGLYIRPAPDVPEAFHNIGIRIEDDVFVTESGCEVYTRAPKSIAEIETEIGQQATGEASCGRVAPGNLL